ncbi:hypothetical protein ACFY9I_42255, partial [Streptomyces sp. NPDC012510]
MARLLQAHATAREAGRARRRAARSKTTPATPTSPSPGRADDSTPAPHGGAAWEVVNTVYPA